MQTIHFNRKRRKRNYNINEAKRAAKNKKPTAKWEPSLRAEVVPAVLAVVEEAPVLVEAVVEAPVLVEAVVEAPVLVEAVVEAPVLVEAVVEAPVLVAVAAAVVEAGGVLVILMEVVN